MLSSFEIKGFRGFSHLRIERLANVNLIIGRNNVGKTNLLEALRFYSLGGHPMAITELLWDREEIKSPTPDRTYFDIDSLFFKDAERHTRKQRQLEIGPAGDAKNTLTVRTTRIRMKPGTLNETEVVPPEEEPDLAISTMPALEISIGSSASARVHYSGVQKDWGPQPNIFLPSSPPFLPSQGITSKELARWWDRVALRDAEQRVMTCLRLVVAEIKGMSFSENPAQPGERTAKIRVSSLPEPVPLKSMGDGMLKMLQIALGLEYANLGPENGRLEPIIRQFEQNLKVLLIDEIENGIHYTVQPDLWKFIISVAQMHNVQVFATSHSWDSILGLREAVRDIPDASVMVIRLEKQPKYTKAVLFDGSELDIVARGSLEVR